MLVRSIADGGSENNPPSLGKKKQGKKKISQLESSPYKEIQKFQPFCCTWGPYVFSKSKATTLGRI